MESPNIKITNINVKNHGKYKTKSGMPRGLIIHFTSGRSQNGDVDAINTLRDLSDRSFGCMVMSSNGNIFRAQNQMIDDVAFHAGISSWLEKTGISYYCMGMEICCAGDVNKDGDYFKSWFSGKYYKDEVREIKDKTLNQWPGFYHKFTSEQEASLIKFCLWQKAINPEFDYDWVIGHDECCIPLGRKLDPGGSLSVPMKEFRSFLKNSK
jgi:N-acetyl-anhydromuramyl-L-alanine amidase AmpD